MAAKLTDNMQGQARTGSGNGCGERACKGWKVLDHNGDDETEADFTNVKRVLFQVADLMPESPSGSAGTSAHGPRTTAAENGGKLDQDEADEEEVGVPSPKNTDIPDNGAFPERFLNSNLAETPTAEQSLNETTAPIADEKFGVVEGGEDENMEDFGADEAFPERVAVPSTPEAEYNTPKHLPAAANNNSNNNNNNGATAAGGDEVALSQPAAASPSPAHTGDNPFVTFPYKYSPSHLDASSKGYSNPFARTIMRNSGPPGSLQAIIRLLADEGGVSQNTITIFTESAALLNACGYDFDSGLPVPRKLLKRLRAQPFAFPRTGLDPFMGAKLGRDWGHPAKLMMRASSVRGEIGEGVLVPEVLPSTINWGTKCENNGLGIKISKEWCEGVAGGDAGGLEEGLGESDEDGVEMIEVQRREGAVNMEIEMVGDVDGTKDAGVGAYAAGGS